MPVYVLGTHVSHNGSACLLKDGKIAVAIEKERITRTKHDGGSDNDAVSYCLRAEGITINDVEVVVQNANFDMFEARSRVRPYYRIVDDARKLVTVSHHLAHAYSTIGTAPFSEMAILIIDGCGNSYLDCRDLEGTTVPERPPTDELAQLYFEKDSYYAYANGRLTPVFKDFSPAVPQQNYHMYPLTTMHSIGGAYSGVSSYVFGGLDDPGKLMGLAPYGRRGTYDFEMFRLSDGRVFLNYDWMKQFDNPSTDYQYFKKHFQYYADIAYHTQREIERALLYVVDSRHEVRPSANLAYAGGVALNAVANRLIRTRSKFRDLYIQPAAGDNGLALGAAYYGWLEVLGEKRVAHDRSTHFGKVYSPPVIATALQANGHTLQYRKEPDVAAAAADLIARGKVIGWFQEGSEFGPRALGHRSILALPTRSDLKEFINSKIKFREDFRPFAPSVPVEDAATYFDMEYDSPYMILVAPTREEWKAKLPAIVHNDGSARVQTVHRDITPLYYRLHQEVKKRTGLSVLLNTSLNKRGMPIVETPQQAISLFLMTALDAIVLGPWLVVRREAPAERLAVPSLEDIFARIRARVAEAGDLGGVLRVVVNGVADSWTLDFSEPSKATVDRSASKHADHTFVLPYDALLELIDNPSRARELLRSKRIEIPGLGPDQPEARERLVASLQRLARLAAP